MKNSAATPCGFARSIYDPALISRDVPLKELAERYTRPAIRDTKDGAGIVFAALSEPYRKSANVVAVTALGYDVETVAGVTPAEPAEVHARCAAMGWWHLIATTYTHTPEAPRYRLILALSEPLAPDLYREVWPLPLERLGLLACTDSACRDPARLYLLPACPANRAHLFESYYGDGEPLNARTLAMLWAANEAAKPKPEPKPVRIFDGPSVIGQFNATHSVSELLEAHGYQQRGRRWAKPGTNHTAGPIVFDDGRAFSHHATDELAGGPHDAFAVFTHLEHGGDVRAAVRALRGAL